MLWMNQLHWTKDVGIAELLKGSKLTYIRSWNPTYLFNTEFFSLSTFQNKINKYLLNTACVHTFLFCPQFWRYKIECAE